MSLDAKTQKATKGRPWLVALRKALLSHGGSSVVLWNDSNGKLFVSNASQARTLVPDEERRTSPGHPKKLSPKRSDVDRSGPVRLCDRIRLE
jgi:hypothetical protein